MFTSIAVQLLCCALKNKSIGHRTRSILSTLESLKVNAELGKLAFSFLATDNFNKEQKELKIEQLVSVERFKVFFLFCFQ